MSKKFGNCLQKEDAINTSEMSEQEMWLALPSIEKEEKADLLFSLARAANCRGSLRESLELAQAALDACEMLGAVAPMEELANCHWGIAFAYKALNENEKAIEEIDIAIKIFQECKAPYVDEILSARAQWCEEMEDFEGTLAVRLESVRQNEIEGNTEKEAESWLNVGFTYSNMRRYEEAMEAIQISRAKFKDLKMVPDVARCDRWISDSLSELGDGSLAYEHARRSMNVSELMQERLPIMFSEFALGKALTVLENYEDAEKHLTNSYKAAISRESSGMNWEFIVKVQRQLIKLLRAQGRISEAEEIETKIASVTEVIE